jgi:chemotaxis protein MotB
MSIKPENSPGKHEDGHDSLLNEGSSPVEKNFESTVAAVTPRVRRGFPYRTESGRWGESGSDSIEIQPHWSVPWADLMMVMMVMFAVMFITQLAERNVGDLFKREVHKPLAIGPKFDHSIRQPAMGERENISAEEILRLSQKLVKQANLNDIDVVLTENHAVKVSVRGNLLFNLGSADLKPDAVAFLDKLAKIIAGNHYQIEVVGHTDNFPISNPAYPTNWELSSARSARVARYLIQTGDLEPGRFAIVGRSYYQPVVANTTMENKARNRRVEIIITRNEYKP